MRKTALLVVLMFSVSALAQESLTLFDCQRMARENAPRLGDLDLIQKAG